MKKRSNKTKARKRPAPKRTTKPAAAKAKADGNVAPIAAAETAPAPAESVMGRPSALTDKVRETILVALRQGNYRSTAAEIAGISPATLYEWIARGENRDPDRPSTADFAEFAESIKRAESFGEAAALQRINDAGRGAVVRERRMITRIEVGSDGTPRDVKEAIERFFPPAWQADAWLLERRHPTRWGRRDRHEISAAGTTNRVEMAVALQSTLDQIYGDAAFADAGQLIQEGQHETKTKD